VGSDLGGFVDSLSEALDSLGEALGSSNDSTADLLGAVLGHDLSWSVDSLGENALCLVNSAADSIGAALGPDLGSFNSSSSRGKELGAPNDFLTSASNSLCLL
jgi:hypothetical protein